MRIPCAAFVFLVLATVGAVSAITQQSKTKADPGPKRWAKAIAAFEKQDRESSPPKNGQLFVGSSSIRQWKLKQSFPDRKAINRGFGGSEISDSIYYARQLIFKHKPRIVVLYAGDNDIAKGKSAKHVAGDFKRFVKTVHATLPKTRILFIAIKPSIKRWKLATTMKAANTLIAAHCGKNERLTYVDIFTPMLGKDGKPRVELFLKDGLHLNAAGYKLWASALRPHLNLKQ